MKLTPEITYHVRSALRVAAKFYRAEAVKLRQFSCEDAANELIADEIEESALTWEALEAEFIQSAAQAPKQERKPRKSLTEASAAA